MTSGQYFERDPAVASSPTTLQLALPDRTLSLVADRGVFSAERIDPGTKLLLMEAPEPAPGTNVVDLGCGYGPIACTLAARQPAARVWAVDVNERALELTRANAARLGLSNVHVVPAGDAADLRPDLICSNPPIRIGKDALHDLLATWVQRLRPGGHAWLVVQKHLGADSLASWLADQGWPTERITSRLGYRILRVTS